MKNQTFIFHLFLSTRRHCILVIFFLQVKKKEETNNYSRYCLFWSRIYIANGWTVIMQVIRLFMSLLKQYYFWHIGSMYCSFQLSVFCILLWKFCVVPPARVYVFCPAVAFCFFDGTHIFYSHKVTTACDFTALHSINPLVNSLASYESLVRGHKQLDFLIIYCFASQFIKIKGKK